MARHLVANYLFRYGFPLGFLVLCYAYFVYQWTSYDADKMMKAFTLIPVLVGGWHFILDVHFTGATKMIRGLPVSRRALSTALWVEGVAIPFLAYCAQIAIGLGLIWIIAPDKIGVWKDISPYFLAAAMLGSGYFLACYAHARIPWSETGAFLSAILWGLFSVFSLWPIVFVHFWDESLIVRALLAIGAVAQPAAAYWIAPRLVESLSGNRPSRLPSPQTRDLADQDTTIRWADAWRANPFLAVTFGSCVLLLFVVLGEAMLNRSLGASLGTIHPHMLAILYYLPLVAVYMICSGPFLSSVRVFGALPISKSNLILASLALPVAAFLPHAAYSISVLHLPLTWWFPAVGVTLILNVIILHWGYMVALVALNCALVLQGCVTFFLTESRVHGRDLSALERWQNLFLYSLAIVLIATACIWTWYLLTRSSAPYKKKLLTFFEKAP